MFDQEASAALLETTSQFGQIINGLFGMKDGGWFKCQKIGDVMLIAKAFRNNKKLLFC